MSYTQQHPHNPQFYPQNPQQGYGMAPPNYPPQGYPQQAQPYPQQGYGQAQPQLPFDPGFADTLIGIIQNELNVRQVPPHLGQTLLKNLNWRAGGSGLTNTQRMVSEVQQWLMANNISLQGSISTDFLRAALEVYITGRINTIQSLQAQQQQQQMQMAPGYPPQGYMPQRPGYLAQNYSGFQPYAQTPQMASPPDSGYSIGPSSTAPQPNYNPQPQQGYGQGAPAAQYSNPNAPNHVHSDSYGHPGTTFNGSTGATSASEAEWARRREEAVRRQSPQVNPSYQMPPAPNARPEDVFDAPAPRPVNSPVRYSRVAVDQDDLDRVDLSRITPEDYKLVTRIDDLPGQSNVATLNRPVDNLDEAIAVAQEALPSAYREGEYLQVLEYDEMAVWDVPTAVFQNLAAKVTEKYRNTADWRALLEVLEHTEYGIAKTIDATLTADINTRLLQYFRVDEQLDSSLSIASLFDLSDLMNGGFGSPQKDLPNWKATLNDIMIDVMECYFMNGTEIDPSETNLSDVLRCQKVNLVHDGVDKYDLAFVDAEVREAYFAELFRQKTFIRKHRQVALTNMLNEDDVVLNDITPNENMTRNQSVFWSSIDAIQAQRELRHLSVVYFFKGSDWSLSAEDRELMMRKRVLHPTSRVNKTSRLHLVSPSVFHCDPVDQRPPAKRTP